MKKCINSVILQFTLLLLTYKLFGFPYMSSIFIHMYNYVYVDMCVCTTHIDIFTYICMYIRIHRYVCVQG